MTTAGAGLIRVYRQWQNGDSDLASDELFIEIWKLTKVHGGDDLGHEVFLRVRRTPKSTTSQPTDGLTQRYLRISLSGPVETPAKTNSARRGSTSRFPKRSFQSLLNLTAQLTAPLSSAYSAYTSTAEIHPQLRQMAEKIRGSLIRAYDLNWREFSRRRDRGPRPAVSKLATPLPITASPSGEF
jgi:hypothetical protein